MYLGGNACDESAHFNSMQMHVLIELIRLVMFITDMFRSLRILLLATAAFSLTAAETTQGQAALARLPLRFEANQGQFPSDVRYGARAGGYSLLLTNRGPELSVAGAAPVAIRLLNSRPAAIEPLDQLSARTNYFVGSRENWHTGVASYNRVRYRGVYPGVDVVYYGSQGQLEYDFVLQPGADPRAIRLKFAGAGHLGLTAAGDLSYDSPAGRIVQKRPVIYQEDAQGARHEVSGRYVLQAKGTVGLKLDGYDRKRSLVIDPVLVYSTYMGGSRSDRINAVRLDSKGLLYVTGQTDTTGSANSYGGDLPATGNFYLGNSAGITDAFLAIIDTTGRNGNYGLVYYSYLGGSNVDIGNALQVDAAGNVYITGQTSSTDFPMVGNSIQTSGAATTYYAFIAELNPNAAGSDGLVYSTYIGGTGGDSNGNGIDLDSAGNIYVIGTTKASDYPVTDSAYAGVIYGPQDTFLCKFNTASSNLLYSTFLGGESDDWGVGIAIGPKGLVYFAAQTISAQFPLGPNSYQVNLKGGQDPVVGVMDFTKSGNGSLVYSTYFGGSSGDAVRGMKLDSKGNIIITGYSLSNDFPVTGDAIQTTNRGNGDAFVSVLNPLTPSSFVVYSTLLGGTDGEVAYGVGSDSAGNLYVAGYTLSADFPVSGELQEWNQGIDLFIAKFKPGTRTLTWSTYLGGATVNSPTDMVVGPDGRAYVVGWTGGQLPIGPAPYQGTFGGGYADGFLVVMADQEVQNNQQTTGAQSRRRPSQMPHNADPAVRSNVPRR
jgi:hypothetical protein